MEFYYCIGYTGRYPGPRGPTISFAGIYGGRGTGPPEIPMIDFLHGILKKMISLSLGAPELQMIEFLNSIFEKIDQSFPRPPRVHQAPQAMWTPLG